jgi:RNA polymerase sigma factor (sigma-70 family)
MNDDRTTIRPDAEGDAELVRRTLRGDREAFTRLARRYQDRVHGLAFHYTGNFEDARDVAQDAFIQAYRRLPTLREPEKFGPWLRQLTANACRQDYRERDARRRREETMNDDHRELPAPDDLSGWADLRLTVRQALDALPEANRLALTLFYFDSYSLEELAAFLGVPTSTVMSRLRNARRQLKKEWLRMTEEVINDNRLPDDWAEKLPVPYDEYDQSGLPVRLETALTPFRERLILSAFPAGGRVADADFENGPEGGIFSPVRATVREPGGAERAVRLWMRSKVRGVEVDARLLPVLARLGLPAPSLLAGPVADPDYPDHGLTAVTDALPGRDVLALCWDADAGTRAAWMEAILDAVERLHALTPDIEADPVAAELERRTLADELAGVRERGGPWLEEPDFAAGLRRLEPLAARDATPPVFSNGIYAPNAFLSADGRTVTGYNDFTFACFEDPHVGFAKYLVYDWYPLNHAGIVDRWRARRGLSRADFALRLAACCLTILQREVPPRGPESADYRAALRGYLKEALNDLS